jgi:hypothetical protein
MHCYLGDINTILETVTKMQKLRNQGNQLFHWLIFFNQMRLFAASSDLCHRCDFSLPQQSRTAMSRRFEGKVASRSDDMGDLLLPKRYAASQMVDGYYE